MYDADMKPDDRIEYWKLVMEDFDESGLSRTEYCEKNEIRLSTFDYWRRRLRDMEAYDENDGSRFAELILADETLETDLSEDNSIPEDATSGNAFQTQMLLSCGEVCVHINAQTPHDLISFVLSELKAC